MASTKRKDPPVVDEPGAATETKRLKQDPEDIRERFRCDLCDTHSRHSRQSTYQTNQPFKHGVIHNLIDDTLLKAVRNEIIEHVNFKPKETDIYRIHQSGDLANLDGLDDASLAKLPSLLKLRDALYSESFREFISFVSECGSLSGTKTDMAANLYTPGCHLLCHDDVIGSRRLSYILYLTDPDDPWQSQWGGALRLYQTRDLPRQDCKEAIYSGPNVHPKKHITPAWNQLSYFAVQPGKSYHDVEEVYAEGTDVCSPENVRRARLAISGWFHVPQEGEPGHVEGLEKEWVKLGNQEKDQKYIDLFERPFKKFVNYENPLTLLQEDKEPEVEFTEQELDFLLKYMRQEYLTPGVVGQLTDMFEEDNAVQLQDFLNDEWSIRIREHLTVLLNVNDKAKRKAWSLARPPHKHKFRYRQDLQHEKNGVIGTQQHTTIMDELIKDLFPSKAFKKWLELACNVKLRSRHVIARHFYRGSDYVLGTPHASPIMQLEVTLNLTPSQGWVDEDEDTEGGIAVSETEAVVDSDDDGEDADNGRQVGDIGDWEHLELDDDYEEKHGAGSILRTAGAFDVDRAVGTRKPKRGTGKRLSNTEKPANLPVKNLHVENRKIAPGGYEAYMTLDDDEISPLVHSGTGGEGIAHRNGNGQSEEDAAIYKSTDPDTDDSILHSVPPCWNVLSIVLRDQGSMRFVKYLSKTAPGDRWDVTGEYKLALGADALGGDTEGLSASEVAKILADEQALETKRNLQIDRAIERSIEIPNEREPRVRSPMSFGLDGQLSRGFGLGPTGPPSPASLEFYPDPDPYGYHSPVWG